MKLLRNALGLFGKVCPNCSSPNVSFSHRKTDFEKALSGTFHVRPFRCQNCFFRFWRLESQRQFVAVNPIILMLGALSWGFALLIPEVPNVALYGISACVVTMVNELYAPRL